MYRPIDMKRNKLVKSVFGVAIVLTLSLAPLWLPIGVSRYWYPVFTVLAVLVGNRILR